MKNPKKKLLIILISLLAVTAVFLCCYSAYKNSNKLKKAEVGSIVTFGSYEQNNDKTDGAEEIEWLVLDKKEDKMLIISKYALDCKMFKEDYEATWENSDLRKWLNSEFLDNAFNDKEQKNIETTAILSCENDAEKVNDKIFVLNNEEASKYFSTDESRKCIPTEYAKARGALIKSEVILGSSDENCCYWLRDSGFHSELISIVDYEGTVYKRGDFIDEEIAVRPALWIRFQ